MGPNRRAQERERAAARAAAKARRAEVERKATAEAERIVAIWNARQAGGRAPVVAAIAGGASVGFHSPARRAGQENNLAEVGRFGAQVHQQRHRLQRRQPRRQPQPRRQ